MKIRGDEEESQLISIARELKSVVGIVVRMISLRGHRFEPSAFLFQFSSKLLQDALQLHRIYSHAPNSRNQNQPTRP